MKVISMSALRTSTGMDKKKEPKGNLLSDASGSLGIYIKNVYVCIRRLFSIKLDFYAYLA